MKTWQERRDELAGEYAHRHEKMGASHEHAECMFAGFLTGFDAGRADALREVRPKLERVRELLKPAYTNQAYIMIEELLKDLAEQEKEMSCEEV